MNLIRILVATVWTGIIGVPLLIVLYLRYWFGLLIAKLGRRDVFDRILDWNAWLAGWVAQRFWTPLLLALVGIRLRVRELVPVDWSAAHVVCANHASIFDILALIRAMPPPFRFVAKRELLKWPIIGWALRPAGQIIVDRGDHGGAVRSIAEAAVRRIRGQVIFFVEGTRTRTGHLLPFKKGAFHFAADNSLPVLPTAICGSYATLARAPWWRMHPGRAIEVQFCAPLAPTAPGEIEPLLEATRSEIGRVLGVPSS
ncbi:MAG: 1-acyl-sn-glycerol-3-phosphate acyltransferase [Deltaproteobacteria bacterium]|nr:1-acyl-sn-glycerol-3-phosphate acyltransferase [Deltaproteobacteria bacterium]